jgi:hypothetical protein
VNLRMMRILNFELERERQKHGGRKINRRLD